MEIKRDSLDVLSYAFGIKQGLEEARQSGVISGIKKGFLCALFPAYSHELEKTDHRTPILPEPMQDLAKELWLGANTDLLVRGIGIILISRGGAIALGGLRVILLENLSTGLANKIEQNNRIKRG